jgi:ABC-type sugar transport system substrate-binding protein
LEIRPRAASLRWLLPLLLLPLLLQPAVAQRVAFINPGHADEAFWVSAGQAMQAAARALQLPLEQHFAGRDPQRALALARELAQRQPGQRPDYVILVNEKGVLVPAAKLLGEAGIPSLAAFSGLLPQEREAWAPRRGLPLLLGTLEPRAEDAGYQTARSLIVEGLRRRLQGPDGRLHLLAIAGDRSTPVSIQRNLGMRRALAEFPQVQLDQVVFADWKRDEAGELMARQLARGATPQLVWAGSDQMALGAMTEARRAGHHPGQDLLFSAINTSDEALQARHSGALTALSGGHFLLGALAVVMLYDHHHGRDFSDLGLVLELPMFTPLDRAQARTLQRHGARRVEQVDYRSLSRYLKPGLKDYRLDIQALLRP